MSIGNQKKRILIFSTNACLSGAPIHVRNITKNLNKSIYDLLIVFGTNGQIKSDLDDHKFSTVNLGNLKSNFSLLNTITSIFKFYKVVNSFKPDLIHVHSSKASFIARIVSLFTRKKVLYTVHGWGWRGKGVILGSLIYLIEVISFLLSRNDFIAVCEDVKNQFFITRNFSECVVLYNSVDDYGSSFSQEIGDHKKLRLIMPARLDKSKDHQMVLTALKNVNRNIDLTFCGSGTNSQGFEKKVNKFKTKYVNFRLLGPVKNMRKLYHENDVLLLASNFEAFPLTILEGLSAGLTPVATDVGGISEVVDTESGFLLNKGDSLSLASVLNHINLVEVRNNRLRMRTVYLNKFTHRIYIKRLETIYSKLAL